MSAAFDRGAITGPVSVLHVSQPTRFGVAHYVEALVADQTSRGWRVTVACPPEDELQAGCERAGATYERWDARRAPGPTSLGEVLALKRIVDRVAPDLVHLHSSKAGLIGRLVVRGRRPTIFTPHAWSFMHEGPLMRRGSLTWERWAARWSDVILCLSVSERERGEQSGIHATFRVVEGPVDLDRFAAAQPGEREAVRARLHLSDAPLAVCVGRLVFQKGQDLLVRVWPEVRRTVRDATLAVIGEGEMRDELLALATPGVTMVGAPNDIRAWLVAADVVVQPSRWEGRSASVLEALACGRSVVATDVEGMREAIGDDPATRAGAIVPPEDLDALAASIAARLSDPSLLATEARYAPQRVERFGLGPWRDELGEVVEDVLLARLRSTRGTTPT